LSPQVAAPFAAGFEEEAGRGAGGRADASAGADADASAGADAAAGAEADAGAGAEAGAVADSATGAEADAATGAEADAAAAGASSFEHAAGAASAMARKRALFMGSPTIATPAASAETGSERLKLDRSACFRIDSASMRTRQITRKLAVVGAAMGVLLTASVASAQREGQGFGQKGEFILSADRLVPIIAFTQNRTNDNNDNPNTVTTFNGSSISLLWGNNAVSGGGVIGGGNPTFFTTPRVGFDYVVIPNLTIGGDLYVFFTLGQSRTTTTGDRSVSIDQPSGNAFGFAPRVGYIIGLSEPLSIWLRGGFSFNHAGTSQNVNGCNNDNTTSVNLVGLDIDPQLVISPIPHFAFTVGPAIDFGFAGGASSSTITGQACNVTTTVSEGYTAYNFGITGGLLGWF
jgi:hypothetical protein